MLQPGIFCDTPPPNGVIYIFIHMYLYIYIYVAILREKHSVPPYQDERKAQHTFLARGFRKHAAFVWGLGFGGWSLVFGVWGSGFRVRDEGVKGEE